LLISVPATSANLGPGFDTLGLAINLRNKVSIRPSRFFSFSIKGEGENNPKLKTNNIYINIFNEHYKNLTGRRDNFSFRFYNKIPLSRGLGSSSAVIVSAIASAYEAANVNISKEKLLNLALTFESHPDNITPAVMGGFTVATVDKNRVHSIKKDLPRYLKAVLVIPNKPISTNQSRKTLPNKYNKADTTFNVSKSSLLTAAFLKEDWDLLKVASQDRMHQMYRMNIMPELFEVQKLALNNGALMSTLSGSGSTFFSMAHEDNAKSLVKKLRSKFPNFYINMYDFDNKGVIVKD
jgi:homoserine kinase